MPNLSCCYDYTGRYKGPRNVVNISQTSLHTTSENLSHPSHPATVEQMDLQKGAQQSFILRFIIFTLLEVSFLVLATWCLIHPIQLPISITNDTLAQNSKAITTAVSVIWHALASLVAKDIVLNIFSAEWAVQYLRTGILQPRKTDAVSIITSGLIDQLRYGILEDSTARFRLSLATTMVLLGLGPLGAGTLGINSFWVDTIQEIQIANLTMDLSDVLPSAGLKNEALERADRLAKSQILDHLPVGYNIPSQNTLIPWPQPSFSKYQGTVKYMTDIITYNYSCNWIYPTSLKIRNITSASVFGAEAVATINGTEWVYAGIVELWRCVNCGPGI